MKLVFGVGVNDADYVVQPTVNGKREICPFYSKWHSVMYRCYSEANKKVRPTYENAKICKDWIYFSNFKLWMEQQNWQGLELDKDILVKGNKVYSPETCVFVPSYINNLLLDSKEIRGEYPLGVSLYRKSGKFVSQIKVNGKKIHIGYFSSPEQAHLGWQAAKAKAIVDTVKEWQNDRSFNQKVANSLMERANSLNEDAKNSRETLKI